MKAWEDSGGEGTPYFAVAGNPNVANVEEFKLFAEYFEEKDIPVSLQTPGVLTMMGKFYLKMESP